MPIGFSSALWEYPLADEEREEANLSSFAYVFEEASEQGAHESLCSPCSELEQRLEHLERSWTDTLFPATVSKTTWATNDAHGLDSVGVAFDMYVAVNGRSIGNVFVGDPYQPLGCDLDDAQSLCRWFSSHLS
ncbi:hypothetical protein MHU86_1186 [Fragilaria crotonensis]|nr:hypothetical protein MHU86_1186 [Fragilaria crotonensis]